MANQPPPQESDGPTSSIHDEQTQRALPVDERAALALFGGAIVVVIGVFLAVMSSSNSSVPPPPSSVPELAFDDSNTPTSTSSTEPASDAPAAPATEAVEAVEPYVIPEGLVVSVTEIDRIPGTKRAIDVVLSRKITVGELEDLGNHLWAIEPDEFDRTFISYFIEVATNNGSWASTHVNPDLEVRVYGLRLEDELSEAEMAAPARSTLVGVWNVEQENIPGVYSIIQGTDGSFTLRVNYGDGSVGERELEEVSDRGGRTFDLVDANNGDYLVVDADGRLNFADVDGVWAISNPAR